MGQSNQEVTKRRREMKKGYLTDEYWWGWFPSTNEYRPFSNEGDYNEQYDIEEGDGA